QHSMKMNEGPLGIPESRMGSGTSWLPDASPMHAAHMVLGDWTLMLHGKGFAQYDWQGGPRGSHQLGFVNWAMAAASRPLGGGGTGRLSAPALRRRRSARPDLPSLAGRHAHHVRGGDGGGVHARGKA